MGQVGTGGHGGACLHPMGAQWDVLPSQQASGTINTARKAAGVLQASILALPQPGSGAAGMGRDRGMGFHPG